MTVNGILVTRIVTPNFITPAMHKHAWERKTNYKAAKGYVVSSTLLVINRFTVPLFVLHSSISVGVFSHFLPKHTQGIRLTGKGVTSKLVISLS